MWNSVYIYIYIFSMEMIMDFDYYDISLLHFSRSMLMNGHVGMLCDCEALSYKDPSHTGLQDPQRIVDS